MDSDFDLGEVVLFELPISEFAQRLLFELQEDRLAWLYRREETGSLFVAATLRAEGEDLAALLRKVQAWVTSFGLSYVPFELDGRRYELQATEESVASQAA